MIAALPMYDRPENAASHDALWAATRDALRAAGVGAPETLDRDIGLMEGWTHPDLVLGQTCGLPFRTRLHDRVTLVATLDYALPDTPPGYYRSLFVTRADDPGEIADFAARRFAYNQPDSHSGWAAPQIAAAALGFRFQPTLETGSHRASARAVAEGRADIAAIDWITWRGIERWEPEIARALRILGATPAAPGQALIASPGADAPATFAALTAAMAALSPGDRETLGIAGITRIPVADYLAQPTPPGP
ncbi:phosphate/phosphite/phosphonate ABC transporter substrate-binding protein [Acidimangrovimonas sediminis]|uniref:phosphate/phosphite/phosphonate ABC transporter substrate-binding protein n=1 Tax=Acidimangrovimonas sediminis TaxID=2056283 RepID=UPI000C7FC837|nr:PhnD/SsuA/transferrin family substrate-binding protein [Acidimangrovimonas sediminis]